MKITPLTLLAAMRIPSLTDAFSDTLAVSSMEVVEGGNITLICPVAHGVPVNGKRSVCVIDAMVPNPIVDLELDDGDVIVTTEFAHGLTTTPDATLYEAWDSFAVIAGTGVTGLDGNRQLVSVPSPTTFVIRPGGAVTLPGSIPGAAAHMHRMDAEGVCGWYSATATSSTRFTMPTPAGVRRSFTVTIPQIATNIRVWGAVDIEHALEHFTRPDGGAEQPIPGPGHLFITPIPNVRMSRDIRSSSDLTAEIQPGQTIRQKLMDGFEVYAVLPADKSAGGVACLDKCHGQILKAVMRTFNGLRMPYTEFALPDPFVTIMTSHGMARYTRANYVHQYVFEAGVMLTDEDSVSQIAIPDLYDFDAALVTGTTPPLDPVTPTGTVPFTGGVTFAPDPTYGIWNRDQPQPLTATFTT